MFGIVNEEGVMHGKVSPGDLIISINSMILFKMDSKEVAKILSNRTGDMNLEIWTKIS